MKSTIEEVVMDGVPSPDVLEECKSIIKQWEEFSGRSSHFTLICRPNMYEIGEEDPVEGKPAPVCTFNLRGILSSYYNGDEWTCLGDLSCPFEISPINERLGIDDIFKLKPHEYGLLRLKHDLYGAWLFFPTQLLTLVNKKKEVA